MIGPLIMEARSWWWRRQHPSEAVGFERPSHFPSGTSTWERLLLVQHFIPVMENVSRPFPPRGES